MIPHISNVQHQIFEIFHRVVPRNEQNLYFLVRIFGHIKHIQFLQIDLYNAFFSVDID